jgi:CubicO group peptidase (beta-lactamase class C family)
MSLAQDLRALIDDVVDDAGPGCVIGLVRPDEPLVTAHGGLANLEHRVPITPDTVFHVASLSKQFTAYAVALLAERGRLRLDDPVVAHLSWFPFPDVTIDQLIRHTSGVRDQWQLVELTGRRLEDVITTDDVIRLTRGQRGLNFPPGTRYSYSNTGYTLLGLIVAQTSGQSLRAFCAEQIFVPLGMTRTRFVEDLHEVVPDRADSYERLPEGGYERVALSYSTAGATSLNTTVADLARWARHTMTPPMRQLREQPVALVDGTPGRYGLGVQLAPYRGTLSVSHDGGDAGYRCRLVMLPELGFAAIVLGNHGSVPYGRLGAAALDLLLGDPAADVVDPAPAPSWEPDLGALVGSYLDPQYACVYQLAVLDGVLQLREGNTTALLHPDRPGRFTGNNGEELWLEVGPDGLVFCAEPGAAPGPWQRLDPFDDTAAPPVAGVYFCEEVDTHVRLVAGPDGVLLARPTIRDTPLRPITADVFVVCPVEATESEEVTLVFAADRTSFTYSTPGAQGLVFRRMAEVR